MNGMNGISEKKMSPGPKTRMCYICGRQYGLSSFEIHIKQCRELWIAREALKIKSERKPVPSDPCAGGAGGGSQSASDALNNKGQSGKSGMNLEEINRMASETFNTVSLSQCEHCGRSFLHEKLVIHNRSCTADKPGRRAPTKVDAPISKEPESNSIKKEKAAPKAPTVKSSAPKPQSPQSSGQVADEKMTSEDSKSSSTDGPLVGHMGGSGGRPIRTANHENSSGKGDTLSSQSTGDEQDGDDMTIMRLSNKVDEMEAMMQLLAASLADVKQAIEVIRRNQATCPDE